MTSKFNGRVLAATGPVAMPIAVYPGVGITRAQVRDVVTNAEAQVESQLALRQIFASDFLLSAMDLSAEAEAFGCAIALPEMEVPSVTGRLVTNLEQAQALAVPEPGAARTEVYLAVVKGLRKAAGSAVVFGGCIGPFSLAARLVGVSEAMELTMTDPDLMQVLIEKSAAFLSAYIRAFGEAGADGVIMAEPAAGLLSPRAMARFSSAPVRQIAEAACPEGFALILHNCAAKALHLPAILETGLKAFHFGAPMDLGAALSRVPEDVVVCGNLDPTAVFVQLPVEEVATRTQDLLRAHGVHRNFVISSGCDIPPNAPLGSLKAFYGAVADYTRSGTT